MRPSRPPPPERDHGPRSLASYKLRFHETHVRAVPERDDAGCPFEGAGVDLRGDEAKAVLALAIPFRAWLLEREPGVVLRSVSVDRRSGRILVTLEPATVDQRPRVVRIDPPHSDELLVRVTELEQRLFEMCLVKLRRRTSRP